MAPLWFEPECRRDPRGNHENGWRAGGHRHTGAMKGLSKGSEIGRPTTAERQARIAARSAEMDASVHHEIWADRIAKATVVTYVALVLIGIYRAAKAGGKSLG
jgi:hypothetical protein